jgi:hypothetical protein
MTGRRVIVYYAWSKPEEVNAPLEIIDNRFPTLFEIRRMLYPVFEELSDQMHIDQSVAGFLDLILKQNFAAFADQASRETGHPVVQIERVGGDDKETLLDASLLHDADTLIILSYDSLRTRQEVSADEIEAVRSFLAHPDHLVFVCPHHDIGEVPDLPHNEQVRLQTAAFLHHGDKLTPPQQRLSGLARSLMAGLGVPVENCFGLRAATNSDGSPAAVQVEHEFDRLDLLRGVATFNLHPHLPHFERLGDAAAKLDVLARQLIDLNAPPHPFTRSGRTTFDAMLQSKVDVFAGILLVADTTLWSSTAGGIDNLRQLWSNVVNRPSRA